MKLKINLTVVIKPFLCVDLATEANIYQSVQHNLDFDPTTNLLKIVTNSGNVYQNS